jgi:hypothetical protein
MQIALFALRLSLVVMLTLASFVSRPYQVNAASCETNSSPVARAGNDIIINRGDSAQFDGSASYDPNGDPLSYRWDFDAGNGIGTDVSGVRAQWPGYSAGTYTATLQVLDGCVTATDTLTVTVAEGFLFDLSVSRTEANPGDGIGYMVTFTNRTNRAVNNAVITLDYDERYLTATEMNGGYLDGGRLIYRQDKIVQGFSETRAFWFTVSEQMPYGETAFTASATLTANDLSNQYSRSVQTVVGAKPTLVVSVTADKATVGRGDVVGYTLTYQNHGNSAAERAQVFFDFDEQNADVVNSSGNPFNEGGRLRWDIGTFYPGQKSSQSATLRVRASATVPEIRTLVRITGANAGNFDQIITASIAGAGSATAGLRLTASASDENEFYAPSLSSHRSELVTLNITVSNNTQQPAEFVLVNADYDESALKLYDRGGATDSGSEASWEIARLDAGATRTYQAVFQVLVNAPYYRPTPMKVTASARNTASVYAEVITTIAEGSVKVKGFTYELPRTGGSLFPLIAALSALAGTATYLKNGRKFLGN